VPAPAAVSLVRREPVVYRPPLDGSPVSNIAPPSGELASLCVAASAVAVAVQCCRTASVPSQPTAPAAAATTTTPPRSTTTTTTTTTATPTRWRYRIGRRIVIEWQRQEHRHAIGSIVAAAHSDLELELDLKFELERRRGFSFCATVDGPGPRLVGRQRRRAISLHTDQPLEQSQAGYASARSAPGRHGRIIAVGLGVELGRRVVVGRRHCSVGHQRAAAAHLLQDQGLLRRRGLQWLLQVVRSTRSIIASHRMAWHRMASQG